ncbi:MAG: hypothetical protein JW795_14740 [Chitinivibrionales bacterium]|nr:hypothetical protein [Chitinivibrionales bacterium]
MMSRLENVLVKCLCDSLSVALCSESIELIGNINSIIGRYPLFNFTRIRSVEALKSCTCGISEWLCLIVDARCSFLSEILTSLRETPHWMPIVLMADSISDEFITQNGFGRKDTDIITFCLPHTSDHQTEQGQNKQFYICPLRGYKRMFDILLIESIKKKLFSRKLSSGVAQEAQKVLFDQNPVTVEGWAEQLDLTPRKLQRVLKYYSDFSPKKIISLYHAYHIAFSTIDETKNIYKGIIPAYLLDDQSKRRVMEYVLSRRSQLLSKN